MTAPQPLLAVAGLAGRLTSSIQTCWPFIIAVALRRTRRPGPAWPPAGAAGDQKPRRSLTMIAVTRPGVITLLMMRMLFTPLGTP